MSDIVRFSVSLETELLTGFDRYCADERLATRIQSLADHFAKPGTPLKLSVVSGVRPTSIGSMHATGRAIDFRIEGTKNEDVVDRRQRSRRSAALRDGLAAEERAVRRRGRGRPRARERDAARRGQGRHARGGRRPPGRGALSAPALCQTARQGDQPDVTRAIHGSRAFRA